MYDNKNTSGNNHSTFYVNQSVQASDDSLIEQPFKSPHKNASAVAQSSLLSNNGSSRQPPSLSSQFVPCHRKSLSLGANCNLINPRIFSTESFRRQQEIKYDKRYIVDDSLVEEDDFDCDQHCPDNPNISKIHTSSVGTNTNACDSLSTDDAVVVYQDSIINSEGGCEDVGGGGGGGGDGVDDRLPSSTTLSICDIRFQDEGDEEESFQMSFQPRSGHSHQTPAPSLHSPQHHHPNHQIHQKGQFNTLHRSFFSTESSVSSPDHPSHHHHHHAHHPQQPQQHLPPHHHQQHFQNNSQFLARGPFLIANATNILNQGYIKRKTILKDGKKPTLCTWVRYWLVLNVSSLVFYSSKSLRGCYRSHFKSQPSKCQSLRSNLISVKLDDESYQMDAFILTDTSCNSVYKFRTNTQLEAITWCREISNVLNIQSNTYS